MIENDSSNASCCDESSGKTKTDVEIRVGEVRKESNIQWYANTFVQITFVFASMKNNNWVVH